MLKVNLKHYSPLLSPRPVWLTKAVKKSITLILGPKINLAYRLLSFFLLSF